MGLVNMRRECLQRLEGDAGTCNYLELRTTGNRS